MTDPMTPDLKALREAGKCSHPQLRFGSGGYYIFCDSCLRRYVAIGERDNEPDHSAGADPVSGSDVRVSAIAALRKGRDEAAAEITRLTVRAAHEIGRANVARKDLATRASFWDRFVAHMESLGNLPRPPEEGWTADDLWETFVEYEVAFDQTQARATTAETELSRLREERDRMAEEIARYRTDLPFVHGFNAGWDDLADKLKFPTMLRKMWSGGEVQNWIDETTGNARAARRAYEGGE